MYRTYYNCKNIAVAEIGQNVTDIKYTYEGCGNVRSLYVYSNVLINAYNIFNNTGMGSDGIYNAYLDQSITNVYVHKDTYSFNTLLNTNFYSMSHPNWSWNDTESYYFYNYFNHANGRYQLRLYPVDNVAAAREANGD